ncbi:MAG: DUF262 domain-containing protein [Gammaproteobacteria bacterium]|nr:DUF262 domain-containing protein [Gammaproteobacteria bacterium]
MKITPNSLTVNQIFSSANEQYTIPSYQRRYSWSKPQIQDLISDIKFLEGGDTHLMGSIVCLIGDHTAGINRLDLVDGQQRLTSIVILLECIRQHFEGNGQAEQAADLARLLRARSVTGTQQPKLRLDSMDQADFETLLSKNSDHIPKNLRLADVFRIVREWISQSSMDDLLHFHYRLLNQALIIRLDVGNAKDAFKLFETINNRGLRLSPTDIIKNFVLGNAARFGLEHLEAARASWSDLLTKLDGINSDVFFRYFLMTRVGQRLTRSEVVPAFKNLFMQRVTEAAALPDRHQYTAEPDEEDEDDPLEAPEAGEEQDAEHPAASSISDISFGEFLRLLVRNGRIFSELLSCSTGNPRIDRSLRNLKMIKAVQTYGFLMHLRSGGCDDRVFLDVLKLTESFVLRRHTCRERANETEALFAALSSIDARDPLARVQESYRRLSPSDATFREEFARTKFVSNVMDRARYCLEQIEMSRHGAHAELQVLGSDDVHIEHIIPQKIKTKNSKAKFGDWIKYLGENAKKRHPEYVGRIGNLTLFSGELNIAASNNPFGKKKPAYKKSSLLLTQEIAGLGAFRFAQVEARSRSLAEDALKLWPIP